ncbi:preprotein translocase subunit SecA [Buchnera aphidicola]
MFFKKSLKYGKSLEELLPEAFATVREASKRVFNMRHFDVQILGGIFLYKNYITEMKTGEGKTLTATLPAYLYALKERGVHIITMNEYLATRDAKKNKQLFEFLGLTVGLNISGLSLELKKKAYFSDITYGTNSEFCFDYLRDNMIFHTKHRVQRDLYYALLDEVDSILIDEARTPLIISGVLYENTNIYNTINNLIKYFPKTVGYDAQFVKNSGDYVIDWKSKQIILTDQGLIRIEKLLVKNKLITTPSSLYLVNNIILIKYFISALRAHIFFKKDIDYIVKERKIIIVDEHTGRMVPNRRWSDGLHQAIEAKEKVSILHETQTLASMTLQNYFKLYKYLSGMTGTAMTEAFEFKVIYNIKTVVIPTNCLMIRKDLSDVLYVTEKEKINAIVKDIQNCLLNKRPVLVGTISIQKSEILSQQLTKLNIKHNVLNAKFYKKEAKIISQAGQLNAVTISTNMSGRGTDIVLGGEIQKREDCTSDIEYEKKKKIWKKRHDLVVFSGGLHVIGTERHESRRIDNQLRGRAGRQGDPGSSRFYLSMEDVLMKIFIPRNIKNIIQKYNLTYGEPIQHNWINHFILYAQKKIENNNFEIRKQLLEYDNILNIHRNIIYFLRNYILEMKDIKVLIKNYLFINICKIIHKNCLEKSFLKKKQIFRIINILKEDFHIIYRFSYNNSNYYYISPRDFCKKIYQFIKYSYCAKERKIGFSTVRKFEKTIMLSTLDLFWIEHLSFMDYLRKGIHFRGYAQKDPKQEYIKEAFNIFSIMLDTLQYKAISKIIKKIMGF